MRDSDWELLYELYRNPNITKVANKLYMSQPSVTKRLQSIENEFQLNIVNRSTKGVEFTPEGEFIAKMAEKQIKLMDDLRQGLKAFQTDKKQIVLGVSYTFSKFHLPDILYNYSKLDPDTNFTVINEPSDELYQRLLDDAIDAAFVRGDFDKSFASTLIVESQGYIVSKDPITIGELPQIPYLEYRHNVKTKELFDQWWNHYHDEEQLQGISVGYIDSVWQFIERGLGYTLCFLENPVIDGYDLHMQPMLYQDGTPVLRNTWFVYPKEREKEPVLGKFIRFINEGK